MNGHSNNMSGLFVSVRVCPEMQICKERGSKADNICFIRDEGGPLEIDIQV